MKASAEFSPGQLVRVRGRDWVVLPPDQPGMMRLRAVDSYDEPPIGLAVALEGHDIAPARYAPPDPRHSADLTGALLLTDALRLSLRNGAGPFRSAGQLSVTPRAYQYVPLVMALRLNPVRMLIADDVGIGKTIEAAMIARELLDRGVVRRIGVLCPAHLCEQWERELAEKFGLPATVILPSTMARLERDLPRQDLSVFGHYRHLVASIDYVKSERFRDAFVANAPDLVIVDEAHGAARPSGARATGQQMRHELVRRLARASDRHLILVTATPHSGVEESFRSLLGLLDPRFEAEEVRREDLVPHIVQRRRQDLGAWEGGQIAFPRRDASERAYVMSPAYLSLYEQVLDYCRETVAAPDDTRRQRVRYWAALSLLRSVLSSPAQARAALAKRAERDGGPLDADSPEELDARYEPEVLDPVAEAESPDFSPSALEDAERILDDADRRRLRAFLSAAGQLAGTKEDAKLEALVEQVEDLLHGGFRPIVFCRFIATAEYVAEELRKRLVRQWKDLQVTAVTGELGDEQRRERVETLVAYPRRILVATARALTCRSISTPSFITTCPGTRIGWSSARDASTVSARSGRR